MTNIITYIDIKRVDKQYNQAYLKPLIDLIRDKQLNLSEMEFDKFLTILGTQLDIWNNFIQSKDVPVGLLKIVLPDDYQAEILPFQICKLTPEGYVGFIKFDINVVAY